MKRLIPVVFAALAALSTLACSRGLDQSIWAARPGAALAHAGGPQSFIPGVFAGVGTGGFGGDIYVNVTFSDSEILAIEVTAHEETAAFGGSTFEHMINLMLARQGADIDAVTGVTASSNAFIAAVADAVSQARLGGGPAPRLSFTPGVFSGLGTGGFGGDIQVSVTVSDGAILGIEVTAHEETAAFGGRIFNHMIDLMLARQSASVDAVAGVTITSNAFIAAVSDALAQAATAGAETSVTTTAGVARPQAQAVVLPPGPWTFSPGAFSGVGSGGYHGNIYVSVTFSNSEILGVEVTAHDETPDFGGAIMEELVFSVIALQDASFDAVAGVTYTSTAFMAAVADAMNQAIARGAATQPAEPATTSATTQASAPAQPAAGGGFTAGTLTATGYGGYGGDVEVHVLFDSSRMISITVGANSETPEFADYAFGEMIPAMLAAQTYDVDLVAGATYASGALRDAVRRAMLAASN